MPRQATREFKARAADRRFAGAVAGQRDLPAAMLYFGDMWDHFVRTKKSSERAVGSKMPSTSALAVSDPNLLSQDSDVPVLALSGDNHERHETGDELEFFDNDNGVLISEYNTNAAYFH